MASITSANAVYLLSISALFPVPQQLQQFSTDEIYATDPLEAAEIMMGVDGFLSAGFVFVPIMQTIMLQADSVSSAVFDAWWANQQQQKDLFFATGSITLPSIKLKYTMSQGVLKTYQALADAGKTLKPRKFTIAWQNITSAIN